MRPSIRRCLLGALVLAMLPLVAAGQTTRPEADAWDKEQFFAVWMNGDRIGYMCLRERALPDDQVESFLGMKITMRVAGGTTRIVVVRQDYETAAGRPLRVSEYQFAGLAPVRTRGVINGDKLELTIEQSGRKLDSTRAWDNRVRFMAAVERQLRKELTEKGKQTVIWIWESTTPGNGASASTYVHEGEEEITVTGRTVRAVRIRESNRAYPADALTWVDKDFRPVAMEMSLGPGMKLRMEACSEAFAHERFDAPEVFSTNLIPIRGKTDNFEEARSMRLTLRFKKPLPEPAALPTTDRQKVVSSTTRQLVLDLTRPDHPAAPADGDAPLTAEMKEYLQATEEFDCTDEEIRKASADAVKNADTPIARGRAIRDWVDAHLVFKTLAVSDGTASEVLRARKGDCTEHTALLVAMARAAGIPARPVSGLVGADLGNGHILGFHEWAQLYLHGRWVDFDAAIPGDPAIAARIALFFGDAEGKTEGKDMSLMYRFFGNVQAATVENIRTDAD